MLKKVLDTAVSVKFLVLVTSTWLFYVGKLTQDGWVTMMLTTTGIRAVNEVAAMYRDLRTSVPVKKGASK